MAQGDVNITMVGNLVADPEIRYTPNGAAVANFRIASTPRVFDRQTNEWKDGDALFMTCTIWREAAENVSESLTKGTRVIVTGVLKSRSYETKEGEKRTVTELLVDEIGPSLKYATAKVNRTQRGNGGQGGFGGNSARNYDATQGAPSSGGFGQSDPWATGGQPQNQGQQQTQDWSQGGFSNEQPPPF